MKNRLRLRMKPSITYICDTLIDGKRRILGIFLRYEKIKFLENETDDEGVILIKRFLRERTKAVEVSQNQQRKLVVVHIATLEIWNKNKVYKEIKIK